jgi:hypothetical protein
MLNMVPQFVLRYIGNVDALVSATASHAIGLLVCIYPWMLADATLSTRSRMSCELTIAGSCRGRSALSVSALVIRMQAALTP